MRPNNVQNYHEALQAGMTVEKEIIDQLWMLFELLEKIQKAINYVRKKGWANQVVYYEDLDTQMAIDRTVTEILGTEDWMKVRPEKKLLPIKVAKNYSTLITNYDQIENEVNKLKRKYSLESFLRA